MRLFLMDADNLYQSELYNLLENNKFYTLPSKKLIDSDQRIALAVWNNYFDQNCSRDDDYDDYDDYISPRKNKFQIEWSKILEKYSFDFQFWEKAGLGSELLNDGFTSQFPEVADYFLSDVEKIKFLFDKTKKIEFISYLEKLLPAAEFIKIKKHSLLATSVDSDDFQLFQDDEDFVLKSLETNIGLYDYLNEENQRNKKIVNYVANSSFYGFQLLSKDLQLEHVEQFTATHAIDCRDLKRLDKEVICAVLENTKDVDLISYFVRFNPHQYQHEFISFLKNNPESHDKVFDKILREIDINDGIRLFKNNVELVSNYLSNWIENKSIGPNTKFDDKMERIIHLDQNLKEKLSSSMEYHFSLMWGKELKIKFNVLMEYFDNLNERVSKNLISKEKMESNLRAAKGMMTVDDLKKYRIPNAGICNYLLHFKLDKEVISEDNKNTNRKNKI